MNEKIKKEINNLANYFEMKLCICILKYGDPEADQIEKDIATLLKISEFSEDSEIIEMCELNKNLTHSDSDNIFSYICDYAISLSSAIAEELIKKHNLIISKEHIGVLIDYATVKYFSMFEYRHSIQGAENIIGLALRKRREEAINVWTNTIIPALNDIDRLVEAENSFNLENYPKFIAYLFYHILVIVYEFHNKYN